MMIAGHQAAVLVLSAGFNSWYFRLHLLIEESGDLITWPVMVALHF